MLNTKKTPSIINIIILITLGILTTSIIFSISLKIFKETGIWIGIFLTTIISVTGLYYRKKHKAIKYICGGMLGIMIISTIIYFFAINIFLKNFNLH